MFDLAFIALTMLHTPYEWGGNNPAELGVDCSGMVTHCLRALGYIGSEDLNAQGVYDRFKSKEVHYSEVQRNDLIFYGWDRKNITHIAIALNSELLCEAAGEGRINTDKGSVRIHPVTYRNDLVAIINL